MAELLRQDREIREIREKNYRKDGKDGKGSSDSFLHPIRRIQIASRFRISGLILLWWDHEAASSA